MADVPNINKEDEKILKEAKGRFKKCVDWESAFRKRYLEDVRFANGDSDNMFQWPESIRRNRETDARPCLTVNIIRQHNLQIINDAKQNKPSVKIRPTGGLATFDSAQVYAGVVRHIEYISQAQSAYDRATATQVEGGIGHWRVVTAYVSDDSFDQELFIRPIPDPLSVYQDPDMVEADGSDCRFTFIFENVPKDKFEIEYPKHKDIAKRPFNAADGDGWIKEDDIRVAEYYRIVKRKDELLVVQDPQTGQEIKLQKSKIGAQRFKQLEEMPGAQTREVFSNKLEWYKIAGDRIIDRRNPPGRYIPVVRVVGEEHIIDGKLDRKGHTRNLKDQQRMYNYNSSAFVEYGALQTKIPYVGPAKAFEGHEDQWKDANRKNYAYLIYNHLDPEDASGGAAPIPPPIKIQPPQSAPLFIDGMKIAADEIRAASGQNQSEMGLPGNERTGKAINAKQRQGENATYHFIDNHATAIRFTGRILLDLIPTVYDTQRVLKILAEDGTQSDVIVDPNAKKALAEEKGVNGEVIRRIFNPSVGKYEIEADVGPVFASRREEAFEAFGNILMQSPQLAPVIADIYFQNADFPGADEGMRRLRRMVPPEALGTADAPAMQQVKGQLQELQGVVQTMAQQLADSELKISQMRADSAVKGYDAFTKRIDVLLTALGQPGEAGELAESPLRKLLAQKQSPEPLPQAPAGGPQAPPAPTPGNLPLGLPDAMRGKISALATGPVPGGGNAPQP